MDTFTGTPNMVSEKAKNKPQGWHNKNTLIVKPFVTLVHSRLKMERWCNWSMLGFLAYFSMLLMTSSWQQVTSPFKIISLNCDFLDITLEFNEINLNPHNIYLIGKKPVTSSGNNSYWCEERSRNAYLQGKNWFHF